MKKVALILLAMVMLIPVPCLAFDFPGHEGQIPFCQNNKTGKLRIASTKDIDSTSGVDYEPYCSTRFFPGTTTPIETLIWVNIQGSAGPPFVIGKVSGLPNLALDQSMPTLIGATGANTVVIASGWGDNGGGLRPIIIQAQVTGPTTIHFTVSDYNGAAYDQAGWLFVEIRYAVFLTE